MHGNELFDLFIVVYLLKLRNYETIEKIIFSNAFNDIIYLH